MAAADNETFKSNHRPLEAGWNIAGELGSSSMRQAYYYFASSSIAFQLT